MYRLIDFDICIQTRNPHPHLYIKYFQGFRRFPFALSNFFYFWPWFKWSQNAGALSCVTFFTKYYLYDVYASFWVSSSLLIFLLLYNIALYEDVSIYLFILLWMDIYVFCNLALLRVKLLWAYSCLCISGHEHLFLLGIPPGVELLYHIINIHLALVDITIPFVKWYANLPSHQHRMGVPVIPVLTFGIISLLILVILLGMTTMAQRAPGRIETIWL